MSEKSRLGLTAFGAAIFLGVLADFLDGSGKKAGIGLSLWIATLAMIVYAISLRYADVRTRNRLPLLIPGVVFAFAFSWRDSLTLRDANFYGAVVLFALANSYDETVRLRLAGVSKYIEEIACSVFRTLFFAVSLATKDITWSEVPQGSRAALGKRIGLGLLIALPLIIVFGALMASADAVFEQFITRIFDWDLVSFFNHVFVIGLAAWISGGYLHGLISKRAAKFGPPSFNSGKYAVEGAVVLGAVAVLFACFVAVQVRYLFGGAQHVLDTAGLTYAEYARRGFFELVCIGALTLPVLLNAQSAMVDAGRRFTKAFALPAGVIIALVLVIIVSAMKRMGVYVSAYGLTELRVYTSAFMVWLAVVFVWMAATVLMGRRERFALGGLIAAFVVLAALNIANPDARIAEINTTRPEPDKHFDANYAARLSGDAVPTLVSALPSLPESKRGILAQRLLHRWDDDDEKGDWRNYVAGDALGRETIAKNRAALKEMVERFVPKEPPVAPQGKPKPKVTKPKAKPTVTKPVQTTKSR